MKPKKCKQCGELFTPTRPLEFVCGFKCAMDRTYDLNLKKKEKAVNDKVKDMKVNAHSVKYKKCLQDEVNLLSRKIDAKFGFDCIDCGKPFTGQQIDACHLISRGKNSTLKYHLHNLHSGHNHCNVYNPTHESNYKKGLVLRYGKEYLESVENLPILFKEIHLTNKEVVEKLALVRKINRTFDTYNLTSGDFSRTMFNVIIGIYNN